jgi:hypothetical protein
MERIDMSKEAFKQYRLGLEVIENKLTIAEYAILIEKSYRQAQRIISKIREMDVLGVVHGNKSRPPHNKTPLETELKIKELLTYKYKNFNLTHAREKFLEDENILIKKDALHAIAKKYGLVKNPKRKGRRSHKPRARLAKEGMMVQFDGSNHVWFGNTRTDLIAGIDDATGLVLAGEFFYGETSNNSMKVIREIVDKNGLPESFYMDQAGIYGKVDMEWESQISRAFEQTGIRLIIANSSQAKGRIERLWRSFQDRLVAELELLEITEINEANRYLKEVFIPSYNLQFSVKAALEEKAYRRNVFGDLDLIFCKKMKRKIMSGNVFSWENITWMLEEQKCFNGREININIHLNGSYSFDIMGNKVQCKVFSNKRLNDYGNKSKLKKAA